MVILPSVGENLNQYRRVYTMCKADSGCLGPGIRLRVTLRYLSSAASTFPLVPTCDSTHLEFHEEKQPRMAEMVDVHTTPFLGLQMRRLPDTACLTWDSFLRP